MWIEKEISIAEIDTLLNNGYEVEVDSPDGYVPVNLFINKGMYEEFVLEIENFESWNKILEGAKVKNETDLLNCYNYCKNYKKIKNG